MIELTEHAAELYKVGLRSIQAMKCDNAKERRKLLTACRNVDKLNSLWDENHELVMSTISTMYPSPAWTQFLRIDKEITRLTLCLLMNARRYGWTPMARSIIYRRALSQTHHKPDQPDPLETMLRENEERMRQPELIHDPMEEVLSAYEPGIRQQETGI